MGDKIQRIVEVIAGLTAQELGILRDEIKKRFGTFSTFCWTPAHQQTASADDSGREAEKPWRVVIDKNSIDFWNEIRIIRAISNYTNLGLMGARNAVKDSVRAGMPIEILPEALEIRGSLSDPRAAARELIGAIKDARGSARMN